MITPALAIDGDAMVVGRIPSKEEIIKWIEEKKIKKNNTKGDKNSGCSCCSC